MGDRRASASRIAVLEDDTALRLYLETVIRETPGLELAFSEGTVAAAIRACDDAAFDLCLVDLKLPDGSGLEFVAHMKQRSDAKCLILTVLGDRQSVLIALHAGADGYLLKDTPTELLRRNIDLTLRGETPLSPQAATYLLEIWKASSPPPPASMEEQPEALTPREMDVLKLFARGLTYSEASQALRISRHTIGDHMKAIHRKLSVHSRGEAVFEARQLGLLSPLD
jgi:DNA-binding NarL/FixJ family response regulator